MQEDIVTKLIEFLVAPHPTTTVLLAEKEQVVHLNFKFIIKMPLYGTMFLLWLLSFYVCSIYQSIKGKKRKRVVKRNSSMSGSTSSKRSAKVSFYFWQNEKYRLSVYYYLWYDTMLHSLVVCLCETSLGKNWSLESSYKRLDYLSSWSKLFSLPLRHAPFTVDSWELLFYIMSID